MWALLSVHCLEFGELRAPEGVEFLVSVTLDEAGEPESLSKLHGAEGVLYRQGASRMVLGFTRDQLIDLLGEAPGEPLEVLRAQACDRRLPQPAWVHGQAEDVAIPDLKLSVQLPRCEQDACIDGQCAEDVIDISVHTIHACAVRAKGDVFCWGDDASSRVGQSNWRGPFRFYEEAQPIALITDAVEVDTGYAHTCVRTVEGEVHCWGLSLYGLLGPEGKTFGSLEIPQRIPLSEPARSVSAGDSQTCAILENGGVVCWGEEQFNNAHLGGLTEFGFAKVTGVEDAVEIAVGGILSCARTAQGAVWCWGRLDPEMDPVETAIEVVPRDALQIAVGEYHACFLLEEGQVQCLGRDDHGQATVPDVGVTATAISAGGNNTCLVDTEGQSWCWGSNVYAQLQEPPSVSFPGLAPVAHGQLRGPPDVGLDVFCGLSPASQALCWVRGLDDRTAPEMSIKPEPERVPGL